MKITTVPGNFGKKLIVLDGQEIKIDHKGECELDNKVAKQLLDKYPETFFDPLKEVVETKREKTFDSTISENLQKEIIELQSQLNSQKKLVESKESDLNEWKSLIEEKDKTIEELKVMLKEEVDAKDIIQKTFELKISLLESSAEKIKETLSKANYPKEEWEKLSKAELINYVMSKK